MPQFTTPPTRSYRGWFIDFAILGIPEDRVFSVHSLVRRSILTEYSLTEQATPKTLYETVQSLYLVAEGWIDARILNDAA